MACYHVFASSIVQAEKYHESGKSNYMLWKAMCMKWAMVIMVKK